MHPFCDFVRLLRLNVSIYHNAKVCGAWHLKAHNLGATCFHIVTLGECLLSIPGHLDKALLTAGDLVIFPREFDHVMEPISVDEGISPVPQCHVAYGDGRIGTGVLCAEVRLFHLYRDQLLDALPPYLLIRNDERAPWLAAITGLIVAESRRIDTAPPVISSVVIDRLSELLFTYALRDHLTQTEQPLGFLGLYAHPQLSKAIAAVHADPAYRWGLDSLAQLSGMSRTSFAEHFKSVSGWTLNRYLTWWRMQLAWEQLHAGQKVQVVAEAVGYQSEAAFSRVFSKQFGVSAGQVRRGEIAIA
ncbi:AraC family transcriptional regulator [Simiduia curdlanivorans]|uniref:AraC family transcriptional regulator n=1 Tax=Simiduia curdlanivorans TaxID=1492769 RepID=A0ABV8V0H1_9GAMM|nr:AraC family transcriptional regulator [Simiduia curdlanivorans]MDN3638101.1 AraC family transcriptional regulator [Simiduia curdlanivorans]